MIDCKFVLNILFGICVFVKYVAGGPLCYECKRIPYPRDCDRIRRCGQHERCYTSQYISTSGAIWFDTGCFPNERCVAKRSVANITYSKHVENKSDVLPGDITQNDDIITCDMCCHGDFCNSHGCGSQRCIVFLTFSIYIMWDFDALSPVTTRGPVCFSCHQQPSQSSCEIVTTCKKGEKCYLLPQSHSLDIIYTTGCMTDAQCDTLQALPSLVGKRNVQTKCGGCCDRDYCNQNCTSLHSIPVYPSATVPLTTRTSLPSSKFTGETTSQPTSKQTRSTAYTTITAKTRSVSDSSSSTKASTSSSATTPSPFIDKASCNSQSYIFYPTYRLCYKLFRIKRTWHDARESCIRDGGDLIVFDNQGERDYFDHVARGIYANINQYERRFWVGATDQALEQHWLWVDGTKVSKNYFHPDEPNNAYSGEDCGAITYFPTDNHTWINDDQCDLPSDYMCQLKLRSHTNGKQACKNSDFQHIPHFNMCYKVYKNNPLNWTESQRFCEHKSAHLLILEDNSMENYFANTHFYNLADSELSHRYWVGGNDFHHRQNFTWLDGRQLSATLTWNPGEPNDYDGNEDCLDFTSQFGKIALNDDDCAKKLYFICQENSH